jgi:hypothetical protein
MAAKSKPKKKFAKWQLVDNAGELWKSFSVWIYGALVFIGALGAFWGGMQNHIDPETYALGVGVIAALGAALRYVKQPTVSEK